MAVVLWVQSLTLFAAAAAAVCNAAERRSRSATQQRPGGNLQPRSMPGLNTGPGQKKEVPARNVNIKLPAMIPSQKPVQLRQKDKLVLLPRSASSSDAGEAAAAATSSQDGAAAAAAAARAALVQAAAAMAEGDAVLDMSSMGQPAHLFEDLAQQVWKSMCNGLLPDPDAAWCTVCWWSLLGVWSKPVCTIAPAANNIILLCCATTSSSRPAVARVKPAALLHIAAVDALFDCIAAIPF